MSIVNKARYNRRRMPNLYVTSFAALTLCCLQLGGADWPRFRGPGGNGIDDSARLPAEFSATHNAAWRIKTPQGVSSPVIANGRLYLTGHDGEKRLTLCVDIGKGALLWQHEVARTRAEPFNPTHGPTTPTPAADAAGVVVFFPEVGLISYSRDGEERWRAPLGPFSSVLACLI